jgi:hypothetical protein
MCPSYLAALAAEKNDYSAAWELEESVDWKWGGGGDEKRGRAEGVRKDYKGAKEQSWWRKRMQGGRLETYTVLVTPNLSVLVTSTPPPSTLRKKNRTFPQCIVSDPHFH